MKYFFCFFILLNSFLFAQTTVVDWSGWVNSSLGTYSYGVSSSTITNSSATNYFSTQGNPNDANIKSPKYVTAAANSAAAPSNQASFAMNGLSLNNDWSSTGQSVTLDINFSTPVCSPITFNIFDLNCKWNGSNYDFVDKIVITTKDASGNPITVNSTNFVFGIASCPCSQTEYNSASAANVVWGSSPGCSQVNGQGCYQTALPVTLRSSNKFSSIRIVYSSASSNMTGAYSAKSNPDWQTVVIGNITATLPPVVTTAFSCLTTSNTVNLVATASSTSSPTYTWTTSTGTINSGSNSLTANVKSPATYTFTAYNGVVANVCYTQSVVTLTNVNCNLLPVELLLFKANRLDNSVSVQWQTLSEKNNDYFVLERSEDGIYFEEIKRIKGAGNSFELRNYFITDENPKSELSYYRLKLIDFNGRMTYSDIVSVEADNSKASISRIAPNPSNSSIGFDFYAPEKGELLYEITDLTGRVLVSESKMVEAGNSKIVSSLDALPVGIYFLKVSFEKTNFNTINKIFKN